ncbi:MAG: type II secretion system GspH family protein [Candidatus Omnitrophica bacterium]|jgi:prepilin-type N-terminal cleavage/methylation domain-containing protein|nr:type II secretion system GspH family protein [Candidatus Omnitrophota bacterium]
MKRISQRGFTLVEIITVVAIILVLIAIAVPRLMQSRVFANEAATMANMKTIWKACQLYYTDKNNFPETLTDLNTTDPPYLEAELASGTKQNYRYSYSISSTGITLNAEPTGILKGRYFYLDEEGSIHANASQAAGPNDEVIN